MGGLVVLYLILAVVVAVKVKQPIWVKGIVLLAALLIPTADAVYGRYKLKQMCAVEGGLKVYRVAENVEGFLASSTSAGTLKKYGFQFTEGDSSPGKYYRFSKQNGQVVRENNVTPKSKFRLRRIQSYEMPGYNERELHRRGQYIIEDIATGEILAADTRFTFKGGWAERFLAQFSGSGGGNVAWCSDNPYPEVRIKNIITSTLKH